MVMAVVIQVKKPVTKSFMRLREALSKPEPFMETDFAKIGRPGVLHQAFRGLDKVTTGLGDLGILISALSLEADVGLVVSSNLPAGRGMQ